MNKKIIFNSFKSFEVYEGKEIGTSDYLEITQEKIDQFAATTLDPQWIHIDPERAKKESPFGDTIAHGYLTLSLATYFLDQVVDFSNAKLLINYGLDNIKFLAPVKVNSKLRMRISLLSAKNLRNTIKTVMKATFEVEGVKKAVCVGDIILLFQF